MADRGARKQLLVKKSLAWMAAALALQSPVANGAEGVLAALDEAVITKGKFDFYARYRFENVDDDRRNTRRNYPFTPTPLIPDMDDAYAHTIRTALGYNTGLFYGFGAYLQGEYVFHLGDEKFNDGPPGGGGSNGNIRYADVVDPTDFEIHQYNLRYEGLPKTVIRGGRQEIIHGGPPNQQRYIGSIPWRQNWQSFDGVRATSEYLANTKVDYAYIWNVNRIFGEKAKGFDLSDYSLDGHLFRVDYKGFKYGTISPYFYLLDFDSAYATTLRLSSQTYGGRFDGAYDIQPKVWKLLYVGEVAHQSDMGENPNDYGVMYGLGELGVTWNTGNKMIEAVTVKGSYELLEGESGAVTAATAGRLSAFQTPLGTNHAFQGWNDRFLLTPGDGIEDIFGTLIVKTQVGQFMVMYHDFNSACECLDDDYDYGEEINVQFTKTFKDHFTFGLRYGEYDANRNAMNVARNSGGGQAFDLRKAWAWLEVKY
jgi:hypothetical protein